MFDLNDWLIRQSVYDEQVQNLDKNLVLVHHKERDVWHKIKVAVEASERYLISQETLWLRRSSQCQPIRCYASEANDDYQIIIMDYLEGRSLSDQIRETKNNKVSNATLLSLFNNINKLHEEGIIHNDIKPNNIIIQNEQAYLIDFASCGWLNQSYTSKKYQSYTPAYTLAEPYALTEFRPLSDWYAYLLLLDLILNESVLILSSDNLAAFTQHQFNVIRTYQFPEKIEAFLISQLNTII
ncbi:hypothetical protein TW85_08270 [Marinomonas sp. S3726]|uniref:protein kinase domain-containing protein n=1 Tax=Marinomonas sp. S3726 TaxID=579484 RepID=UPI0005FA62C8|nr:protein kinase [Marinomonas sp. S3726]KJZ14711.1 hypothetical protein TW85_08270 [Marinomonas sp. S3726]